jgi:hypothetical protein
MTTLRRILTGATLVVMVSGVASASIIYNYQSTTLITSGPDAGDYNWQYIAQLSSDQQLSSAATDFAVVFDFEGVVGASTFGGAPGLTMDTILQDTTTPQPYGTIVPDDPSIENVVTSISGNLIPTGLTKLYTIDIVSTFGLEGTLADQSAQAEKYSPGEPSNGTVSGNTVEIEAPSTIVVGGTPEPATFALMGGALICLGSFRKRYSKN